MSKTPYCDAATLKSWVNVLEPPNRASSEHGAGLDKKDGTVSLP